MKKLIIALLVLPLCTTVAFAQQGPKGPPPSPEKLIEQMDSNKDGKLSATEVKGPLKDNFEKFDANKDGFLTKEELENAPREKQKRPKKR